MEEITIVGIQSVNFTDQQSGRVISGRSYFFTQQRDHVSGLAAGKLFVSNDKINRLRYEPQLGDVVCVFYNRSGKPEDFQLVE